VERRPRRLRQLGYALLASELAVGLTLVGVGGIGGQPERFYLGVLLVGLVLTATAIIRLLE
jgi:hypothetical protein